MLKPSRYGPFIGCSNFGAEDESIKCTYNQPLLVVKGKQHYPSACPPTRPPARPPSCLLLPTCWRRRAWRLGFSLSAATTSLMLLMLTCALSTVLFCRH